jgi:hypothetical protein
MDPAIAQQLMMQRLQQPQGPGALWMYTPAAPAPAPSMLSPPGHTITSSLVKPKPKAKEKKKGVASAFGPGKVKTQAQPIATRGPTIKAGAVARQPTVAQQQPSGSMFPAAAPGSRSPAPSFPPSPGKPPSYLSPTAASNNRMPAANSPTPSAADLHSGAEQPLGVRLEVWEWLINCRAVEPAQVLILPAFVSILAGL